MTKKLTEAQYTLSVDGLNSTDADTLSRILSLAGQAEMGGIGSSMDADLGLGSTNALMPGDDALGSDLISGSPVDDLDDMSDMDFDEVPAEDPMDLDGVPGELGSDPIEDTLDDSIVYEADVNMDDEEAKAKHPHEPYDCDDDGKHTHQDHDMKEIGKCETREYSMREFINALESDEEESSQNIIMQLRKVLSLRNAPPKVVFADGSSDQVPEEAARTVLKYFNSIPKPNDKRNFMELMSGSVDDFGEALMVASAHSGVAEEVDFANRSDEHTYDLEGMRHQSGGDAGEQRYTHAKSGNNPLRTPDELNEEYYQTLASGFEQFVKDNS